ncbi:hypothetical protein [Ferrimonas pelagia]|uniref:Uncharacterized protein n=1 Tax=Ferrimonas pelagia TaxID=1177826 RepID=A0ABP9EXS4_9GAMM
MVQQLLDITTLLHLTIALFGGLNCLLLALFLGYLYRDPYQSQRYLALWFVLMALYFFYEISAWLLPIWLIPLLSALHFFALPSLYLHLRCQIEQRFVRPGRHLLLACPLVALQAFAAVWLPLQQAHHGIYFILWLLALLQLLGYVSLGIRLWRSAPLSRRQHSASGRDLRLRWLLSLTLCAMLIWLLRLLDTFYQLLLSEPLPATWQLALRGTVLLLMIVSWLVGLRQISLAAWYRREQPSPEIHPPRRSSEALLNSEELAFLQELNRDK